MKIRSVDFLGSLIGCARKELYYSYLIQMFICFKWIRINCLLAHKKSIFFFLVCVASLRKSLVSWRGYNVVLPRHSDTIRMRRWHVLNNDADKKKTKKKKTKHVLEHTVTFRENYCCYSLFIISVHFLTAVFLGSLQYLIVCSAAFLTRRIIIRQLFLFFFFKWKLLEIWHLISVDCRPAVCVWKRLKHLDSSIDTRERKSPSPPPTNVFCFFLSVYKITGREEYNMQMELLVFVSYFIQDSTIFSRGNGCRI
jgi:hypothetical protein